jgi:hypothetical protein
MKRSFLFLVMGFLSMGALAGEFSITVAPTAHLDYRGEGKILPQGYVNRFDGNTAPLYRFEWLQDARKEGYWGLGLWHTGVFGGGTYGNETIPDVTTGRDYQSDLLNVGFTNLFVTYHRPLAKGPVEAQVHLSVVREIFKRKGFVVQEESAGQLDDVNEISAEGIGFGLAGTHGDRVYFRWQAAAHYYVQLFDAKTDASAGSIFQGEAGIGWRFCPAFAVEVGGLWQDWFILGQGNRRLHVEGTEGAVISYNRQQTTIGGMFLRLETRFGSRLKSPS